MVETNSIQPFLDDAHVALAERIGKFAAEHIRDLANPQTDDEGREQARAILETLGRAGWFRSTHPIDLRASCLIREALGHASPLADEVFALQALGTLPVALGGSEALKQRWLTRAREGEVMAAFAMTEVNAGSDVAALQTRARREGDHYVIDGAKTLISNAGIADFYSVFAKTDASAGHRGISCFLVPADAPGLRFARAQVLSAPHPLGELSFEGCRVPADHLLGDEGGGFKLGMKTLDSLRATVAAAACGMAQRALDEALQHALARKQFGAPLADLPIIQDKLARMAIELSAARLLVYRAAALKDGGAERVTTESAMAKAFATEAAQRIIDQAVQIVGGRGVLADHPVDRLYRAIRPLRIYEGATEVQHLVIARALIKAASVPPTA